MSFNLEFNASSVVRARELVAEATIPDAVKSYVMLGLDGLDALNNKPNQLTVLGIAVKAVGHLCADGNSYEVTTATIEVKRIFAR